MEDSSCSICLNPVRSTRHNPPIRCGHIFHRECIKKWKAQGHHTCPMCRKVFDVSKFRVILTIENQYNARSNTLTPGESQIFSVFDCFDIEIPARDDSDLDSLLTDLGIDLDELSAVVLESEG